MDRLPLLGQLVMKQAEASVTSSRKTGGISALEFIVASYESIYEFTLFGVNTTSTCCKLLSQTLSEQIQADQSHFYT